MLAKHLSPKSFRRTVANVGRKANSISERTDSAHVEPTRVNKITGIRQILISTKNRLRLFVRDGFLFIRIHLSQEFGMVRIQSNSCTLLEHSLYCPEGGIAIGTRLFTGLMLLRYAKIAFRSSSSIWAYDCQGMGGRRLRLFSSPLNLPCFMA